MKRYFTLALALVLVLLCGMQIVADSADLYIICQHQWYPSYDQSGSYTKEVLEGCLLYKYDVAIEVCSICGMTREVDTLISVTPCHDWQIGTDGKYYCSRCWAPKP